MKSNIFDRLLLFLTMLIFFFFGVGIVAVKTIPSMTFAEVGFELDVLFDTPYGLAIAIGVAVVIVLISIRLIIVAFSHQGAAHYDGHEEHVYNNIATAQPEGNTVLIKSTEHGNIEISPSVIRELAIRKAKMSDKVKDVSCRVEKEAGGSKLHMRFVLMSEVKMDEFMVPMQEDIKKYVEEHTGTTVTGVEIRIEASEKARRERVK